MTWVVKLGGSLNDNALLPAWLQMLAQAGAGRVVIVPGGGRFADEVRRAQAHWHFDDLAAHNMAVLAMAQSAHLLCGLNPALQRCDREADIAATLRQGRTVVWSPLEWRRDRVDADTSWDVTSDSIALALAQRLGATRLVVVKSCDIDPALTLDQLGAAGIVDRGLAARATSMPLPIEVIDRHGLVALRSSLLTSDGPPH